MNLLDLAVLGIFALFVLSGLYKGFLSTVLSIGAFIVSGIFSMIFMPLASAGVVANESLYNMMLYYTEGGEYIGNVELSRTNISTISAEQLKQIITDSNLPYPMGKEITRNIAKETFASQNVTTLGEYFNQTIVCVFINILMFLLIFVILRLIIGFVINGMDFALKFPVLRRGDALLGMGAGVLRGMLALFLIFMLLPILLTVLGQFDLITNLVDGSFFASFFYKSNFLLSMMPGT
ncbi:MAG: CvpA family protein [Clostridia bacterium]